MTAEQLTEQVRVRLPDGTDVYCPQRADALMLWREIFEYGGYAEAADGLRAGDPVLDVGANIGLSALYFARRVPGVRILAVEPARTVFDCLRANLAEHVPGALALDCALGDEPTVRELCYYPRTPSQSGFYTQPAADDRLTRQYLRNEGLAEEEIGYLTTGLHVPRAETVTVSTVSELCERHQLDRIGLLKIDVERAEMEVLAGIADADWARIDAVAVEVHDIEGRLTTCVRLLRVRGFAVTVRQESWLVGSELYSVVARRREREAS
jgi:FkbM family methyltransferase